MALPFGALLKVIALGVGEGCPPSPFLLAVYVFHGPSAKTDYHFVGCILVSSANRHRDLFDLKYDQTLAGE